MAKWALTKFAEVRDWLRRFVWHSQSAWKIVCTECRFMKVVTEREVRDDKKLFCHMCGKNTVHELQYYDHERREDRVIKL